MTDATRRRALVVALLSVTAMFVPATLAVASSDGSTRAAGIHSSVNRGAAEAPLSSAAVVDHVLPWQSQQVAKLEAGEDGPLQLQEALEQQRRSGATAQAIQTALDGDPEPANIERAVYIASQHQAATMGFAWEPLEETPEHNRPSEALATLADCHDTKLSPAQQDSLEALDRLPTSVAGELTDLVDAFLALETATQQAYANANTEALAQMWLQLSGIDTQNGPLDTGLTMWDAIANLAEGDAGAMALKQADVDLSAVFPARSAFFNATRNFASAWQAASVSAPDASESSTSSSHATTTVAPVFAIDSSGTDNKYTEDVVLSVDVGGNDTYHNNAGGTMIAGAGALVDLGSGTDEYGDPANRHDGWAGGSGDFGVNGGGTAGAGFLFDEGGNDTYSAGDFGTNGGSVAGVGFLMDRNGSDTYLAGGNGTNGGSVAGVGLLMDRDGNDTYEGTHQAVNGGGFGGVGLLVDREGNDTYDGTFRAVNGGAALGVGVLLDRRGNDTYGATRSAVNGGGLFGIGALVDEDGTDRFQDNFYVCDNENQADCTRVPKGLGGALVDRQG